MEHEKWVWSDQHLFHDNTWALFRRADGYPLRPFKSTGEMHQTMLTNHNALVQPQDKVYWLGDITFEIGSKFNELMHQFNGHKRLIIGNHDGRFLKEVGFTKWFEKIDLWRGFKDKSDEYKSFTMTHIPLPLEQIRDGIFNVHGHMHDRKKDDLHYINVCVEQTNYTPLHFDQLFEIMKHRKKLIDKGHFSVNTGYL